MTTSTIRTIFDPARGGIKAGLLVLGLICALLTLAFAVPVQAQSGDRTLNLYFPHTGERAQITFRRNGAYDQAGLNQLNHFLRDWRKNAEIKMDPALFDLVWTVYQEVGATDPINVVSAYRSPATNEMLRRTSNGVAENSRHTHGQAMDFFIPGVPLEKLRETAMRHQVGGVGYYPTSGSPFVHLDTGNVRAWPRMTKAQLERLFPDGRTLHLPAEGNTPLSHDGRKYALAQWQKCKSVPCVEGRPNTQITGGTGRGVFDLLFGGGGQTIQVADNSAGSANAPSTVEVTPVFPAPRAGFLDFRDPGTAPIPADPPQPILVAMRQSETPVTPASKAAADLAGTDLDPGTVAAIPDGDTLVSAYAPASVPEPDADKALQDLIQHRHSTGLFNTPDPASALRGPVTASLGGDGIDLKAATDFLASTFSLVTGAGSPASTAALTSHMQTMNVPARAVDLVAPDFESVSSAMVIAASFADSPADLSMHPHETALSPATELGIYCRRLRFSAQPASPAPSNRFTASRPLIVAAL